ncbi:MAG TPA: PEGA domain-containing protein [Kofleriaceae bacterium]|nr:PEGA domain-containing protein [Kofleriaceae bacterium]
MSVRRGWTLVLALLAVPDAAAAGEPAGRRIAFASLAGPGADVSGSIDSARNELATLGHRAVPPGELRDALEGPLPEGSGDASAAGPLRRARERLSGAKDAFAGFEYERALTELDGVDEVLLDIEPSTPVIEVLIERYLLAGVIQEGRKRPKEARESFRVVHHLDPGREKLDAGEYRPQVVRLYAEAVRGGASGSLRVSSAPAGARVWIDGRLVGESPVDAVDIGPGGHWVVATAGGHEPKGTLLTADAGKRRSVSLDLAPRPAPARVTELRRTLTATRSSDEIEAGAAQLAGAAEVDALVLVRERRGRVESAVYDSATGELGAWFAVSSRRLASQIDAGAGAAAAAGGGGGGADLTVRGRDERDDRAWYATTWGTSLLIAGGVVVVGAVVLAVVASGGDDETSYEIGAWCFDGACP